MEELDKKQVKKDLEKWASKLRKAHQEILDVYHEMNKVYQDVSE